MFPFTKDNYSIPKEHSIPVNIAITAGILGINTAFSFLLFYLVPDNQGGIYLLFMLAMVLISKYTNGYIYGIISSLYAVICINYTFTYPFFKLNFTLSGYPLTFALMLSSTLVVCTMTSHLCEQMKIIKKQETQLREAELEKMRANLLRAVSHDLRTPLTGMIGNSSIYLENYENLPEKERLDMVRSIYNDANWLLNMVENLLTVTRIQGDNLQVSTSPEPVEEVVSEALMRLNKRFPDAQIHAKVPDEMLFVPMDAVLIEQVIINLIENAIVHSGSERPLDLIVADEGDHVSFTIKDYGVGIAPQKLDNLFDGGAFSREESSDTHKGMGIGLSICKTIITAHHGKIYGKNHEEGALFCFLLPKGNKEDES